MFYCLAQTEVFINEVKIPFHCAMSFTYPPSESSLQIHVQKIIEGMFLSSDVTTAITIHPIMTTEICSGMFNKIKENKVARCFEF